MISDDCKYYGGGNFMCNLSFPPNYPHAPPTLTFLSPIPFHPNIYSPSSPTPGLLCISILHPPEEDIYGYEAASERWNPVQTPETILLSVISLFYGPNDESPANVEAARLWREEERLRKEGEVNGGKKGRGGEFARECRRIVRVSQGDE